MNWARTTKWDPMVCALANRHYPALTGRRKVGAPQWLPPADTVALRTLAGDAGWGMILPRFRRDAWADAWVNSFFRNEGDVLSSQLIREALAATRHEWPDVPEKGCVTFVDVDAIRRKRDPGRCYRKAGFRPAGYSAVFGRLILRLAPEDFPDPAPPLELQLALTTTA